MSIIQPELEILEESGQSIRYLEHGWPDPLCRWHSHKECELHLILCTHGKVYVGDYIGDFSPETMFLTGPHLPHNWITDKFGNEPVPQRDMVIQFDQDRIDALSAAFLEFEDLRPLFDLAQSGIEFKGFDFEAMQQRFALVRDTSGTEQILAFLELLSATNLIETRASLSVLKLYHANRNSKQIRISGVVDHIVDHFSEEISVAKAAEMAGMSTTAFSRNFQTVTGNKFVEFVNRVRIGQACNMLYATEDQITTICFQAGFQNLANFNRHFLKMKNMTPSAYRELAREELTTKARVS